MEKWKLWLIVSSVCSVICGVFAGVLWGINLYNCDPGGGPFDLPASCWLDTYTLEMWWIIPLALLLGFIGPSVVWLIVTMWAAVDI